MIAIVFDISEKVEDFVSRGASTREIIFDYYLNFIAFYGTSFMALIVFLSTIFFTSRLAGNTEIVAILTGGVSFRRMLVPYIWASTIIFIFAMLMNHYIIPSTNIYRINFENTYVNRPDQTRYSRIHRQIHPGEFIFFETYNPDRKAGYHFSYEKFDNDVLSYKLKADFIRFDETENKWRLDNWNLRTIDKDGNELIERGKHIDTTWSFQPEDIAPKLYTTAMMKTPELLDFIEKEKLRGSENISFHEIELHKRTSFSASVYILVLIAVSLCSRKKRGGIGLNIAIGLLLAVVYIFLMQIATTFSTHGNFPAWAAVWLPNMIFAVIGIQLYFRAPK